MGLSTDRIQDKVRIFGITFNHFLQVNLENFNFELLAAVFVGTLFFSPCDISLGNYISYYTYIAFREKPQTCYYVTFSRTLIILVYRMLYLLCLSGGQKNTK